MQEPAFIPKAGGGEGEGWLIALVNRLDVLRNDVVIWDARDVAKGPVATIRLPFRLKMGLHGNFVDHADIEAWERRREGVGDVGPLEVAREPLPWQVELQMSDANGTNGSKAVNGEH